MVKDQYAMQVVKLRKIGCGNMPFARNAFTISLTRSTIAVVGVEKMSVVLNLRSMSIGDCRQAAGELCCTRRTARTSYKQWRPGASASASTVAHRSGIRSEVVESHSLGIGQNCFRRAVDHRRCGFDHKRG